jgi:hypothetical protein
MEDGVGALEDGVSAAIVTDQTPQMVTLPIVSFLPAFQSSYRSFLSSVLSFILFSLLSVLPYRRIKTK